MASCADLVVENLRFLNFTSVSSLFQINISGHIKMNLNELRRLRNKAVRARNEGPYQVREKRKANNATWLKLRERAKKHGINIWVKTWYGIRNKTLKELQNNFRRKGLLK